MSAVEIRRVEYRSLVPPGVGPAAKLARRAWFFFFCVFKQELRYLSGPPKGPNALAPAGGLPLISPKQSN